MIKAHRTTSRCVAFEGVLSDVNKVCLVGSSWVHGGQKKTRHFPLLLFLSTCPIPYAGLKVSRSLKHLYAALHHVEQHASHRRAQLITFTQNFGKSELAIGYASHDISTEVCCPSGCPQLSLITTCRGAEYSPCQIIPILQLENVDLQVQRVGFIPPLLKVDVTRISAYLRTDM